MAERLIGHWKGTHDDVAAIRVRVAGRPPSALPDRQRPSTGAPTWLRDFDRRLVMPAARAFVDWATEVAGAPVILDRDRFEPADLKPWLGDISILQWDAAASDYRYRLFGSNWPEEVGRDLTGQSLSIWPQKVAHAIRSRVHTAVARHVPVGAHVVTARYTDAMRRGHAVFEQVLWPLRYGPACAGAVLALSVIVLDGMGLDAPGLVAATGRHSTWFAADGAPLVHPPPEADALPAC